MLATLALLSAVAVPPDLALAGVILGSRPDRAVAILRAAGRTRVVRVGESAFGGRLVAITATEAHLLFGMERATVRLGAAGALASLPAPPPRPAPVEAREAVDAAEDPATPARDMDRAAVERRLGDEIPRILAETTVHPVTEDGRVSGVLLSRVPAGSLLTDAGLRAGDILTHVNGVPIDGLATLAGLWGRLQNETDLRAVVLRGGRPVALSVTLR